MSNRYLTYRSSCLNHARKPRVRLMQRGRGSGCTYTVVSATLTHPSANIGTHLLDITWAHEVKLTSDILVGLRQSEVKSCSGLGLYLKASACTDWIYRIDCLYLEEAFGKLVYRILRSIPLLLVVPGQAFNRAFRCQPYTTCGVRPAGLLSARSAALRAI